MMVKENDYGHLKVGGLHHNIVNIPPRTNIL